MERSFGAREYRVAGEILHVLALRVWLARNDILKISLADAVAQGRQYIDDLYAAGQLEGTPPAHGDDLRFGSSQGLGFFDRETPEFGELYAYFRARQDQALLDTLPSVGNELLETLRSSPEDFVARVTSSEHGLARVPVLAALKVADFANAFLPLHPSQHRNVLIGLKERYAHARLANELAEERPWLLALRSDLLVEAGKLSPIGKHRLQEQIRWSLDKVLGLEDSEVGGN
jgi:hypothetical protein